MPLGYAPAPSSPRRRRKRRQRAWQQGRSRRKPRPLWSRRSSGGCGLGASSWRRTTGGREGPS
eukprot:11524348-Alexandrium_andersonii.AAC.1